MTDDAMRLAIQEACSVYNDNSLGEEAADSNAIAAVISTLLEKLRDEEMREKIAKVIHESMEEGKWEHEQEGLHTIMMRDSARAVIEALEKELV